MDDYWKVKMNHSPTPNLTLLVLLLFTTLVVGEDSEILPVEFPSNMQLENLLFVKSEHMYIYYRIFTLGGDYVRSKCQIDGEDFVNLCGLRKNEIYRTQVKK